MGTQYTGDPKSMTIAYDERFRFTEKQVRLSQAITFIPDNKTRDILEQMAKLEGASISDLVAETLKDVCAELEVA